MMRYRHNDLLVRIAVADAYTLAAEMLVPPYPESLLGELMAFDHYVPLVDGRVQPGRYTDDTEMSAANVHVLIEHEAPYTPLMFADAYVREFQAGGQRGGYAKSFQAFLPTCRDGADFLARIRPTSDKNGAAMRAMPIGVLPDVAEVLAIATLQSAITHDTPAGLFSGRAVALMTHFSLYDDAPLADLGDYCRAHLPAEDLAAFGHVFAERWPGGPVVSMPPWPLAVTTVWAAFDLVTHATSRRGIIEQIIRWGGDTDSVAAIAVGIASARFQDERLPEFMERDLEPGHPATGVAYLRDLGTRLMERFDTRHPGEMRAGEHRVSRDPAAIL